MRDDFVGQMNVFCIVTSGLDLELDQDSNRNHLFIIHSILQRLST